MKKITLIFTIATILFSCTNRDLYDKDSVLSGKQQIDVKINWLPDDVKPTELMRINLFSLNEIPSYGVDNMSSNGGRIFLPYGSKFLTLFYSYFDNNNIYFRNESNPDMVEAYTVPMTRASYTRAYPQEVTYAAPAGAFYIAKNDLFDVTKSDEPLVLNLSPRNVMKTYTFEIRGVQGTQFISDTRGAISGMANSILLSSGTVNPTSSTLLFNATAVAAENVIRGSFQTFGRMGTNSFSLEILFPSPESGIMIRSWDVTNQISNGTNFHIIIEDSGIVIPDEGRGLTDYSPAESPNVSGSAVSATGVTSYTYTAPTTASTTEDFIVAHNMITTTAATPGTVALNFKHALSMVSFKAQNNSPGATFVIEKIELVNLGSKATLTNTPTSTPGNVAFGWSVPTVPANFVASFAKAGFSGFALEPMATPAYKLLTTDNEYLTVIPQTTAATGSLVRVTYHAYDATTTFIPAGTTKDFVLVSQPFVAGNHYQFGFKFTAGNAISFTADVLPWVGPTGVDL